MNLPRNNGSEKPAQVDGPVLLFDGVCNLCNGAVQFIIRRDRRGEIHFAPLQWEGLSRFIESRGLDVSTIMPGRSPENPSGAPFARSFGNSFGNSSDNLSSVLFIDGGHVYSKSEAVLRVARYLHGVWPILSLFRVIPRSIRDAVYDYVARNRFRWFGHRDACMVPTADVQSRFLNGLDAGPGSGGSGG